MSIPTYIPIATQTINTTTTSLTFSSIPQTYKDLKLVISAEVTSSAGNLFLRPNSDSTLLYSRTRLVGNGSTAISQTGADTSWNLIANNGVVTTPNLYIVDIFSYASSNYKTSLWNSYEDGNTGTISSAVSCAAGLYRSTTAITTLNISTDVTSFANGSTFTLWGI